MLSSTESLRKDHFLIEKMMRALDVTAELLKSGKTIPPAFLEQALDFTNNFTNICHHGKEEDTLFPALEKGGMPREGGPIARMLFEHEMTKELAGRMNTSAKIYLETGDPSKLVEDIRNYVNHVSQHLTKENFRLFVMADMILQGKSNELDSELKNTEATKLQLVGKTRMHYEQLVTDFDHGIRTQG